MMKIRMKSTINMQGNVIESLKKMLISRDTKVQLKAVIFMNSTLEKCQNQCATYKAVIEYFISSDLCIFLCEASATLQGLLIEYATNIIMCLRKFSGFRIFYNNSYAPMVVSSITRTIHFLMKENVLVNILEQGLYLMSEMFFQVDYFELSGVLASESSYDACQLLELLCGLLDATNIETDTMLATSLVLHSVISQKNYKSNINLKTIIYTSETITKCIKVLYDMIIENHFKCSTENKTIYIFGMLCHTAIDALNFTKICEHYTNNKNLSNKYTKYGNEEIQSVLKYKELIIQSIYHALTAIISQLENFDPTIMIPNNEVFLYVLNMFLNDTMVQDILPTFVQHLYDNNFLKILQIQMSSRKTSRNCPSIMAKILYVLSTGKFSFSNWKGGPKAFEKHLYEGLIEMKPTVLWIQKLNDHHATDAVIDAILVFYYFMCLKVQDPEKEASVLYKSLLEFILSIPTRTRYPDPTTKCLWLIFATAGISIHKHPLSIEELMKFGRATEKIAYLISVNTKELYTHHPVMIYWAFSSNRISREIQKYMLSLWLEKEDRLPYNLGSKCTVWSSLVELIQNGPPNVSKSATDQLKHCIDSYCDEDTMNDISNILWNTLPETLSSFAVGRMDVTGLYRSALKLLEVFASYFIPDAIFTT